MVTKLPNNSLTSFVIQSRTFESLALHILKAQYGESKTNSTLCTKSIYTLVVGSSNCSTKVATLDFFCPFQKTFLLHTTKSMTSTHHIA